MAETVKKLGGTVGWLSGLLALLAVPGVGIILLILGLVLIAVFIGLFVGVYLILQSIHIWTATVFTVVTVFLFYIGTRTRVINGETLQRFPWLPLLIPGAFLFGYLADVTGSIKMTVAPMALSSTQQGSANAIIVFLLIVCILFVVSENVSTSSKSTKRRK